MTPPAEQLAEAALSLVDSPFRLHGRDPATGIDCLGLVGAALAACGRRVRYPQGYRLRNSAIEPWLAFAPRNGLALATGPVQRGEVHLVQPGPAQHHLLIALGNDRFVHAHAGLRKTVIQTLNPAGPPLKRWRLGADPECVWLP
ncbi:hypothetical protein [Qipengyuania flava]|uniref:hypothetical protein n=1 Tax=Qipengyuania flava TaxID=192812 RepID=UPI001C638C06|nr:hypothetical protein [Qipengyuania flava]QYJ07159.1 hypothetical protein KUV82_00040 [Qipengyuania flava]